MRVYIEAIAQDVHMNTREINIPLQCVSAHRVGKEGTPEFNQVEVTFKLMPITIDISDGFNPFDTWYTKEKA